MAGKRQREHDTEQMKHPHALRKEVELELVDELFGDVDGKGGASWLSGQQPCSETPEVCEGLEQPAWDDEDDDQVQIDLSKSKNLSKLRKTDGETLISGKEYTSRLREQFGLVNKGKAAWAEGKEHDDHSESEDSGDLTSYLRTTTSMMPFGDGSTLSSREISVMRMKDANESAYMNAVVQSVRFHRNGQLLLTAGFDKKLRLFNVDGHTNSLMQSMYFSDLPIKCASFTADGSEVWLSGARRFFYVYDMESGSVSKVPGLRGRNEKDLHTFTSSPDSNLTAFACSGGVVSLVSNRTKQVIGSVKANGSVRSISFSHDSSSLYSFGSDGMVMVWDVAKRRCRDSFADHGCIHGNAIACGSQIGLFATGSESGVVNLYESCREPTKSFMSLTTAATSLAFNHDSQLLAIASFKSKDALRLVHVPSRTVFSNWPTSSSPLHYVSAVDFSPHSGFLAIGNDRGRVLLYRINHYQHA